MGKITLRDLGKFVRCLWQPRLLPWLQLCQRTGVAESTAQPSIRSPRHFRAVPPQHAGRAPRFHQGPRLFASCLPKATTKHDQTGRARSSNRSQRSKLISAPLYRPADARNITKNSVLTRNGRRGSSREGLRSIGCVCVCASCGA